MKRLLLILALLLVPANANSMFKDRGVFWFCAQMGSIESTKVMATSYVHRNNYDWTEEDKAKQFEAIVAKRLGEVWQPQYPSFCVNHEEQKEAEKHLDKIIIRARKLKFDILFIDLVKERKK